MANVCESRKLKRARPQGRDVDLLRIFGVCYSLIEQIITYIAKFVKISRDFVLEPF